VDVDIVGAAESESPSGAAANCPSCGAPRPGKFCSACGEKRVDHHDYALGHFLGHLAEAFAHADGKLFLSLRQLLAHPGVLTADFFAGKRRPYLHPLSLFIFANTVFFLALPLLGWDTLTTPLESHLHEQIYAPVARWVMARHFAPGVALPHELVHAFDHQGAVLANSLVILMVPLFTLPLALLVRGWRWLQHGVFALHFWAFTLFLLIAELGLTNVVLHWLWDHGWQPSGDAIDHAVSGVVAAVIALYLYHAIRRAYGAQRWLVVKAIGLALLAVPVVQAYRLILFLLTTLLVVGW
jgi:hypothetical protein